MMRSACSLSLVAWLASGCANCGAPKPGMTTDAGSPTVDVPPASLGASGLVVDQPLDGDALTGQWVSVTGWIDRSRWASVIVTGAPVPGFYLMPSGHLGVATVPVLIRPDGRFIAPRVPLVDGSVEIDVVPMPATVVRAPPETIRLTVKATQTASVPATALATPPSGSAPFTSSLGAFTGNGAAPWEWDFDGDGVTEVVSSAAVSHTYATLGVYSANARTKDSNGRWIYAVTSVVVPTPSVVLDSSTSVDAPRDLAVVTDYAVWNAELNDDGIVENIDESSLTRAVLVTDGDVVKVFDAHLKLKTTLTGLSSPGGVCGDTSHFFVADTGHNQLVRFNTDGSLDKTFGTDGAITATADGTALRSPTSLVLGFSGSWADPQPRLLMLDSNGTRLIACDHEPMTCTVLAPVAQRNDDPTTLPPAGLTRLAAGTSLPDLLYTPPGGAGLPGLLADQQHLYSWSKSRGGSNYDLIASPGKPLVALSVVPAFNLIGMSVAAGADSSGGLGRWLAGVTHGPRFDLEQLGYPVTALAFDAYATASRVQAWRTAPGFTPGPESGPQVLYVAGPGHLERRLLSSVQVLRW